MVWLAASDTFRPSIEVKFLLHRLVHKFKGSMILTYWQIGACEKKNRLDRIFKQNKYVVHAVHADADIDKDASKYLKIHSRQLTLHWFQDSSMIFFLMAIASSATEAWACSASTRHCSVSSFKVSMLSSNSSSGRIAVVGILFWHATKTWGWRKEATCEIVALEWIMCYVTQHQNMIKQIFGVFKRISARPTNNILASKIHQMRDV